MSVIDQKEYLKKYLGIGKGSGERKKKKKSKKIAGNGLKIVDDDEDVRLNEEIKVDLTADNEDAPQIVSVIDDRPPSLRIDEATHTNLWQPLGAPAAPSDLLKNVKFEGSIKLSKSIDSSCSGTRIKKEFSKNSSRHKSNNFSPDRKIKREKSEDTSPPRRTRRVSDDASPSRRHKLEIDSSPLRKIKREKSEDYSPPRKTKREVDDSSPPRKSRYSEDSSPPRRNKRDDEDSSPPRKSRREKSEDQSPPRRGQKYDNAPHRKNNKHNTDYSPTRKIKIEPSEDNSPPRKNRKHDDSSPPRNSKRANCEDISPPRRHKRSEEDSSPRKSRREKSEDQSPPRRGQKPDNSPPRKNNKHNTDYSPTRKIKIEPSKDNSPPRKNRKQDNDSSPPRKSKRGNSEDISPPRRHKRSEDDSSPRRNKSGFKSPPRKKKDSSGKKSRWGEWGDAEDENKMQKTLDGKKAGLQNARDLASETRELKKREDEIFKNMSAEVSGANAATVVRGKKKEVDWEEEERKRKKDEENKEQYNRWGKGLKQVEDTNEKIKNELYEMSKPLARYADDEDLEKYLKDQEREGDPMLAYLRKKKKKKDVDEGKPILQQYMGDAPPNRFGIRPGYRWDGVDRSNGYEKQWFQVQNSRTASMEESYKWSTEDM